MQFLPLVLFIDDVSHFNWGVNYCGVCYFANSFMNDTNMDSDESDYPFISSCVSIQGFKYRPRCVESVKIADFESDTEPQ